MRAIDLTFGSFLSYGNLRIVVDVLRRGGVCLLPSDTCYSLAAIPALEPLRRVGVLASSEPLAHLLLAFGSLQMVQEAVVLSAEDSRLIDTFCPGPLTLVCEARHGLELAGLLPQQNGKIALRLPDSPVETQLSVAVGGPVTTCAVRDEFGEAIRSFELAKGLVQSRMHALDRFPFVAVRVRKRVWSQGLSTVAEVQSGSTGGAPYEVQVYRSGAIEPEVLQDALRRCSPSDWEDWT